MRVRVKPKRNVGIRGKIYTAGQEIEISEGEMNTYMASRVDIIEEKKEEAAI